MPSESFWRAVERLQDGDDAGADLELLSEQLLEADASLGDQLQEAISALDLPSLAQAVRLSDGMDPTEDAMIAVGCAVLGSGPEVYAEGVRDPESLARPWDLSRGDLLLFLNPGLTLFEEGEEPAASDRPYSMQMNLGGDSRLGWFSRQIGDAVAYQQCHRAEETARWRAILSRRDVEHLIIELEVAPAGAQKVTKVHGTADRFLFVEVSWSTPRSLLGWGDLVETVLEAVATRLERA